MFQAYPSVGQLITLLWGKNRLKSTEVVPEALMLPLPGGFRLHQKVVALYELLLNSDMKVPLGSLLKTWTTSRTSGYFYIFLPYVSVFLCPTKLGISPQTVPQFPRLSWTHHWKPRGRQSDRPL